LTQTSNQRCNCVFSLMSINGHFWWSCLHCSFMTLLNFHYLCQIPFNKLYSEWTIMTWSYNIFKNLFKKIKIHMRHTPFAVGITNNVIYFQPPYHRPILVHFLSVLIHEYHKSHRWLVYTFILNKMVTHCLQMSSVYIKLSLY
jgi:hypothetical protein